ncbi:hypothetical protein FACS1894137_00470 [Spirochaetia bacterium]|nr:hypothetical protein FACS1894137_00470 [Spirochaetia bacterium]
MPDDIIGKVFSLISGEDEPDSDKKVLLKQVVTEINQNKYAKFFKLRTEEIDPSFAAYLYEIYKIVYPACVFVQNVARVYRMRQLTVEAFMTKEGLELIRKLRPEAVQALVKTLEPKDLSRVLREDLASLFAAFDGNRITAMNRCYYHISALIQFAQFNFLSLLRRFDAGLPSDLWSAGAAAYTPQFQAARAADLVEEMGQFRAAIQNLEPGDDWKNALAVLKIAGDGQELFPLTQWNMLLTNLRELKNSAIIELVGQYTAKNPIWQVKYKPKEAPLAETWLEAKGSEVQEVIDTVLTKQRNSQIEALATAVFGTPAVTKLQFYNSEISGTCIALELDGFAYAAPLNYLLAFIQDFVTKEMQELCDILLVRGQWVNNPLSLEMSNAVHTITDVTEKIEALDTTLSDTGPRGPRFRSALTRADKNQARFINSISKEMDDEALALINAAVQGLVAVGKFMKSLLGDSQKSPSELIINWKELGYFTKVPMSQRLTDAYKKINYFVQLMLLQTEGSCT